MFQCRCPGRLAVDDSPDEVTLQDCSTCTWRPRPAMPEARKLILKNHLSPGDVLVMTAAVRCLHAANPGRFRLAVDTTWQAAFEHSPDVEPLERAREEGFEEMQTHYPLVDQCNQVAAHFMEGYCRFFADNLRVPCPLSVNRPYVYLSRQEREWMGQVHQVTGHPRRYWVVNAGVKQDYTAKQYPYYQQVVDRLQGQVYFVQVGKKEHLHRPLRGVLDLLDGTDDRQLIRLVHHADGVLCGTTLLMHLAAALEKPSVILAGGREPRVWNQYPRSAVLSTVGCLPCCRDGGCWKSRTVAAGDGDPKDGSLCECPCPTDPPAPKCMVIITPEEVAQAVLRYRA